MQKTNDLDTSLRPPASPILVNKRNNAAIVVSQEVTPYEYFVNNRKMLYKAQGVASQIGESRVRVCNLFPLPDSTINIWSTEQKRMIYKNLIHCSSVWTCPVCSYKIKQERKNQIQKIMKGLQTDGYRLVFLTLTKSHSFTLERKPVYDLIHKVNSDYRKITSVRRFKEYSKKYGIEYIKTLEITYKNLNGFHPHLHIILAFNLTDKERQENTDSILMEVCEWIVDKWVSMNDGTQREYSKIKIVYDNNYAHELEEYISKYNLSYEMTDPYLKKDKPKKGKGINPLLIPFLLLEENAPDKIKHLVMVYNVYEYGSKYARFTTYSDGLKARYLDGDEKTDAEICQDTSMLTEFEAIITNEAWNVIKGEGKRAEMLQFMEECKQYGLEIKGIITNVTKTPLTVTYNENQDKVITL